MARGKGTDKQSELENDIANAVSPRKMMADDPDVEDAFERMMREDTGERINWSPEAGDWVVGPIVSRRDGIVTPAMQAKKIAPCTILTIRSRLLGCDVEVWCSRTVLRNECAAQNPQPGQICGIKYFGVKGVSAENEDGYHAYSFRLQEGL